MAQSAGSTQLQKYYVLMITLSVKVVMGILVYSMNMNALNATKNLVYNMDWIAWIFLGILAGAIAEGIFNHY